MGGIFWEARGGQNHRNDILFITCQLRGLLFQEACLDFPEWGVFCLLHFPVTLLPSHLPQVADGLHQRGLVYGLHHLFLYFCPVLVGR